LRLKTWQRVKLQLRNLTRVHSLPMKRQLLNVQLRNVQPSRTSCISHSSNLLSAIVSREMGGSLATRSLHGPTCVPYCSSLICSSGPAHLGLNDASKYWPHSPPIVCLMPV